MKMEDIKHEALEGMAQVVIFDREGRVIESDEQLVSVLDKDFRLFSDTMFTGMEDSILGLTVGESMTFECVQTSLLDSYCDFTIRRISDDRWVWLLFDFDRQYRKVFEMQQQRNLAEMKANRVLRSNEALSYENEALERLYQELKDSTASEYILVKADKLLVNVDLRTINFLEAYGDYVKVHTDDRLYLVYSTFAKIEQSLPSKDFARIHRSYMVRMDKIENIEQLSLSIRGELLPMTKTYKTELLKKMGQL